MHSDGVLGGVCFQKHLEQEEGSRIAQRKDLPLDVIATSDSGDLTRGSEAGWSY